MLTCTAQHRAAANRALAHGGCEAEGGGQRPLLQAQALQALAQSLRLAARRQLVSQRLGNRAIARLLRCLAQLLLVQALRQLCILELQQAALQLLHLPAG